MKDVCDKKTSREKKTDIVSKLCVHAVYKSSWNEF